MHGGAHRRNPSLVRISPLPRERLRVRPARHCLTRRCLQSPAPPLLAETNIVTAAPIPTRAFRDRNEYFVLAQQRFGSRGLRGIVANQCAYQYVCINCAHGRCFVISHAHRANGYDGAVVLQERLNLLQAHGLLFRCTCNQCLLAIHLHVDPHARFNFAASRCGC